MAAERPAEPSPRISVWLDDRPAPRRYSRTGAEQPALDRAAITAATVALLDAEGTAKFSMRRLAGELGVTAMSLYWYVNSKDELMELAVDAVQAELTLPDLAGADWRESLRLLAAAYRRMLVDHPWVARTIGQYLNIGPEAMRFAGAAQSVLGSAGLRPEQLPGALAAVFQFVNGFASVEANWNARLADTGMQPDEFYAMVLARVDGMPQYADSLELRDEADRGISVRQMRQNDFDTALELLIAGVGALREGTDGAGGD
ncbi:TetR/AcrR family transcriptional regulator C-terminal domain-containing protein [Streptomyces sp. XM4193]|uniref:TetR/AcrR family transcriptional regulator n=1 Tax=Streptomyces sp. XM4193 TaxID=2929782 RepID=UPI001FFAE89C|nr:TetR/AcrR family transcriptional regulator C-terminal domain-containing protein [Streptomyces sp. XM4193]MCK1794759.1 TetR/AcrR family transcriptional regulator C-terminal domain-containing protein [Streptomyces sp. XM4193]